MQFAHDIAASDRPIRAPGRRANGAEHLEAWIKAAQTGNDAAYKNLVRVSIPFIKAVARKQGVPADLLDDVVQETMLTVHQILPTYDAGRPFAAWLRMIAQRRAIDIMRSRGRTALREVFEPVAFENHLDPAINPEDSADHTGRRIVLGTAMTSLPVRQREAVEQLALMGRSLGEASFATGLSQGALRVNLHRALNALRDRISIAE